MMSSMYKLSFAAVIVLSATMSASQSAAPPVGRLSRAQVEDIIQAWGGGDVCFDPRWKELTEDIKRVRRGATIRVFMGAWCNDSKREIPQFMRIVDLLEDQTPFAVEFFAIDEQKKQPAREIKANAVSSVPTFIVIRNGREVGRIVEQPARTLEKDLLRLLNGTARGLLSSNENAIVKYLTSGSR